MGRRIGLSKWVGGRLPTEAEWEYAAKGGQLSKAFVFAGSDNCRDVAVFIGNTKRQRKARATLKPNELGLYDMSGDVWEWCSDWYGEYKNRTEINPQGAKTGKYRVIRGGSWNTYAEDCRSAYRGNRNPISSGNDCGFRVVFDVK